MSEQTIRAVYQELWIARTLGKPDLFDGVTTADQRKGLLRAYLLSHDLGDAVAGHRGGEPERWSSVFERLHHEPLGVVE